MNGSAHFHHRSDVLLTAEMNWTRAVVIFSSRRERESEKTLSLFLSLSVSVSLPPALCFRSSYCGTTGINMKQNDDVVVISCREMNVIWTFLSSSFGRWWQVRRFMLFIDTDNEECNFDEEKKMEKWISPLIIKMIDVYTRKWFLFQDPESSHLNIIYRYPPFEQNYDMNHERNSSRYITFIYFWLTELPREFQTNDFNHCHRCGYFPR